MIVWNLTEHTDEENLQWSWFRAIEWGRWPAFVAQPIAPILLLFLPWQTLVISIIACNLLWALVRYRYVSVGLASAGRIFVMLKWPVSVGMGAYFFFAGDKTLAGTAALWPFITLVIGILPTTQIGKIQKLFMNRLGYASVGDAVQR